MRSCQGVLARTHPCSFDLLPLQGSSAFVVFANISTLYAEAKDGLVGYDCLQLPCLCGKQPRCVLHLPSDPNVLVSTNAFTSV